MIGHLVQKHVVKDTKTEEEKYKVVLYMGVQNVKVPQGKLKDVKIRIVQVNSKPSLITSKLN